MAASSTESYDTVIALVVVGLFGFFGYTLAFPDDGASSQVLDLDEAEQEFYDGRNYDERERRDYDDEYEYYDEDEYYEGDSPGDRYGDERYDREMEVERERLREYEEEEEVYEYRTPRHRQQ